MREFWVCYETNDGNEMWAKITAPSKQAAIESAKSSYACKNWGWKVKE